MSESAPVVVRVDHLPDGMRARALIRGGVAVKNAGWRDTYASWLSPKWLDDMDARMDATVADWVTALGAGRLLPTWVATVPDAGAPAGVRVVGIASSHPAARPHDRGEFRGGADGLDVELDLAVLYVDAHWRGRGIAERLAREAIGEASAFLWVLEDNPRARAFYTKLGFEADGAVEDLPEEWHGAREIRMVRRNPRPHPTHGQPCNGPGGKV